MLVILTQFRSYKLIIWFKCYTGLLLQSILQSRSSCVSTVGTSGSRVFQFLASWVSDHFTFAAHGNMQVLFFCTSVQAYYAFSCIWPSSLNSFQWYLTWSFFRQVGLAFSNYLKTHSHRGRAVVRSLKFVLINVLMHSTACRIVKTLVKVVNYRSLLFLEIILCIFWLYNL